MLSDRQEKILNSLVKESLDFAEPIGSSFLKKRYQLDISPATIRNELQELTEQGYITQPHISAGRVPTKKAYKYFVDVIFQHEEVPDLKKEIDLARKNIEKELKLVEELTKSLTELSTTLSYTRIQDKDTVFEMLKIIGPGKATYHKNISIISQLIEELEKF